MLQKIARLTLTSVDWLLGDEPLEKLVLKISDPQQIAMLRLHSRLTPGQRESLDQLLTLTIEVGADIDEHGKPVQSVQRRKPNSVNHR
jgi:hypothetical protein